MKHIILFAIALVLFACGGVKLAVPTAEDATRGGELFEGMTLADLEHGKMLYEKNCDQCHKLKDPKLYTAESLDETVPNMVNMLNDNAGKELVTEEQTELIRKYMITMGPGAN